MFQNLRASVLDGLFGERAVGVVLQAATERFGEMSGRGHVSSRWDLLSKEEEEEGAMDAEATELSVAVLKRDLEWVKELLREGANPNQRNKKVGHRLRDLLFVPMSFMGRGKAALNISKRLLCTNLLHEGRDSKT